MVDEAPRSGTQAVERALAILRVLEQGPDTLPLTELADRAGLSASTTHRLVRALCDAGILRQDLRSEQYGLGPRLVALGQRAEATLGLADARPTLEQLAVDTGESVNLGVLDGAEVVVLLCIPSAQRLRFDQAAGSRVPAYASAMGKALLAFTADPEATVRGLPDLALPALGDTDFGKLSFLGVVAREGRREKLWRDADDVGQRRGPADLAPLQALERPSLARIADGCCC